LVLRHGNFATVDGNIFIGDDDSDFYGGVRVVNTGHLITNNYFYKINGSKFRSPLAIMNGIPKSPINRYKQVTDVVIAYNTWVDCKSPIQVGVGQNIESSSVLPPSEIRSAPPIRSIVANNLIFNHAADDTPAINHDNMDGVKFHSNLIDNNGEEVLTLGTFQHQSIRMKQLNDWLFAPEEGQSDAFSEVYKGYGFDRIERDLFGSSRSNGNSVGAISQLTTAEGFEINKKKYGPSWYLTDAVLKEANVVNVSAKEGELANKIAQAEDGDVFLLTDKVYTINTSLEIGKDITIFSEKTEEKTQLVFVGGEDVPAFEMNPYGTIRLENVALMSKTNQMAFAPLKQDMSAAYNLFLDDCSIDGFNAVLKAYKGSFADTIKITNTNLQNCKGGLTLAAESKGDYNAEMVIIEGCEFVNVHSDVIHYFRGGYDESTIGGSPTILNSTFKNCGSQEKSGTLLKTRGVVNVFISGNTFQDNPVKLVALLWGEKNNRHEGNTVIKSGQIKVEEQLKLDLLY
jgi:poly(beta-D-mannuronate) lyase